MDINKAFSKQVTDAVETKKQNRNFNTTEDLQKIESSSVSIFSPGTSTQEEQNKAYSDYANLMLSEIYDENKDGKTTVEEFGKAELTDSLKSNKLYGMDTEEDNIITERISNQFATNLDSNEDRIISPEELAFFNKTADDMHLEEGTISTLAESVLVGSYLDTNTDQDIVNGIFQKFINGEELNKSENITLVTQLYYMGMDLTPEQQKIFDDNNSLLRQNINSALENDLAQ